MPYKHFEDFRELALMVMLDGMAPFKRRKHSCWPIIIINLNLKPDIRMHQDNIICIGAIPGPHSPKDINSFLQSLVDELVELAKGVEAVDVVREEVFALRAYIIAAAGDIPVISKLMEFIGHNERFPCWLCMIQSVSARTANNSTHLYCPLHRADGPSVDPLDLPLRTHDESIAQGYKVLQARNEHSRAKLATECGVKGVTLLARLSSIRIPDSFPVEVMHMVWINLIPQLMDLWQKKFHDLDTGTEQYGIDPLLVASLGDMCTESGALFPSDFGCRVPHFKNRSHFTAESWSIWALQYAPCLLRRRFRKSKYYIHFVRLINIMNEVMHYEIQRAELPRLRNEIAQWVQDFEEIYYQYDDSRLQICTTNAHYLLHIVDSIERMGPVCVYWSYPMERYCSFIGAGVKSCRFPYANIARRLLDVAQLRTARELYDLHDLISFGQTRASTEGDKAIELAGADKVDREEYNHILLLTPRSQPLVVTKALRGQINKYLATAFKVKINKEKSKDIIPESLKQWGRMRITGGGDLIHARGYHKLRSDGRDASFVRYEQMVDRLAHRRRAKEDLRQQSCYGQLRHIFQLDLPPKTIVNQGKEPRPLLLAMVYEAPVVKEETYEYPVVWYEGELSKGEVVDASTIACAVARVKDHKRWWIVDRSLGTEDIEFVD
ncbi:transposase family Tnp2 protein [Rhizoctonia solani 123E]|uniref:Transposase family Tnp2 protein n=1 Tax=Rhizoctonia solani 123E TaxID=1423351 RepID=A0A074RHL4_9AGAM|nr:transposase family Tnp2 protein [Rhizoctonia solani 123E]